MEIKAALAAAGKPIGPNDAAMSRHAVSAGVILVTNNMTTFKRVPGLVLEDRVY